MGSDARGRLLVLARDGCCGVPVPPRVVPALENGDYSQPEPDDCRYVVLVDYAMRVLHLPPLL